MANFLETQPRQYAPYVSQQPIEAMVKVGMHKQEQYQKGVEKIQGEIDKIAGLDIAQPVARAYMQSKINQLGNDLTMFMAADFSDFQLATSTAGMAKQVYNDPNVQQAVASTARYRKEVSTMEADRAKGELTPQNEHMFNKSVTPWLNSTDVKSSFNGRYEKYFDWNKFVREGFDAVKPDEFTFDQIFVTDSNGDPIKGSDGQPVLSTTMQRLKKEGRFPPKVEATLNQLMSDARVNRQLQIDGVYNYRNVDGRALSQRIGTTRDTQLSLIDDGIIDLRLKMNTTSDANEKELLRQQIDALEDGRTKVDENYKTLMQSAIDNPDYMKGELFKEETKNRLKTMFGYVKESRTVEDNPAFKAKMDIEKFAFDQAKHKEEMNFKYTNLRSEERRFAEKQAQDLKIATLKASKDKNNDGIPDDQQGRTPKVGPTPTDLISPITEQMEKTENLWNAYTTSTDELLVGSGLVDQNLIDGYKSYGMDDAEATKAAINKQAKQAGETPSAYRAKQLVKSWNVYSKNAGGMDPALRQKFSNSVNANKALNDHMFMVKDQEKQAPLPGEKLANTKTLTISVPDTYLWGNVSMPFTTRDYVLTPQDQSDIMNFAELNLSFGSLSAEQKGRMNQIKARLAAKGIDEGKAIDIYRTRENRMVEQVEAGQIPDKGLANMSNLVNTESDERMYAKRAGLIKQAGQFYPNVTQPFLTGDVETNRDLTENMKNLVTYYANSGQNLSPNVVKNAPKFLEILNNPEKGHVTHTAKKNNATGEVTPVEQFFNAEGELVGELTISLDQAADVGFYPGDAWESEGTKLIKTRMNVIGGGRTTRGDAGDTSTYEAGRDSAYEKSNFPLLQGLNMDVQANVQAVDIVDAYGNVSKGYYNYVYINDYKHPPFVKRFKDYAPSEAQASGALDLLTPEHINLMIKQQYNK